MIANALDAWAVFWLIAARLGGALLIVPFLGTPFVPVQLRVLLTLLLAAFMVPVVPHPQLADGWWPYAVAMLAELGLGMLLGFLIQLVFLVTRMIGEIVDTQMGFAVVQLIDPQTGNPSPVTGQFLYLLTILIFLLTDGHLLMIQYLAAGFEQVPPGVASMNPVIWLDVIDVFRGLFQTAVGLTLPVAGSLFLLTVALGILSRAIPQLNVFVVGLPLQIGLGFGLLLVFTPFIVRTVNGLFSDSFRYWQELLQAVAPG